MTSSQGRKILGKSRSHMTIVETQLQHFLQPSSGELEVDLTKCNSPFLRYHVRVKSRKSSREGHFLFPGCYNTNLSRPGLLLLLRASVLRDVEQILEAWKDSDLDTAGRRASNWRAQGEEGHDYIS